MSDLTKLESLKFPALTADGEGYIAWSNLAEAHLFSNSLEHTLVAPAVIPPTLRYQRESTKAVLFLKHHMSIELQSQYRSINDPMELWKTLKDRFDHQRLVLLPKALQDWN